MAVHHDATLDRTTNLEGPIAEVTSRELKKSRLEGGNEPVPLLEDVLEMVDGRVPILIELKGSEARKDAGPLERAVWKELRSTGAKRPCCRSVHTKFLSRNLAFNTVSRPDFIAYEARALPHPAVTFGRHNPKASRVLAASR